MNDWDSELDRILRRVTGPHPVKLVIVSWPDPDGFTQELEMTPAQAEAWKEWHDNVTIKEKK